MPKQAVLLLAHGTPETVEQIPEYLRNVIVRGGYRGSGTEPSGKPFTEHLRWTDTWVKTPAGKWQVVATQYTPVKA